VTINKAHGRVETRTLTRSTALREYVDWPNLAQAFKRVPERTTRSRTTTEVSYGITSLPPDRAPERTTHGRTTTD
jgi:hypothetical protein